MVRGRPLWPRRLEVLLAQVAAVVAKTAGNKVELVDFDLYAPPPPDEQPLEAEEGAKALAVLGGGVGVRHLGSKRRQLEQEQAHGAEHR